MVRVAKNGPIDGKFAVLKARAGPSLRSTPEFYSGADLSLKESLVELAFGSGKRPGFLAVAPLPTQFAGFSVERPCHRCTRYHRVQGGA